METTFRLSVIQSDLIKNIKPVTPGQVMCQGCFTEHFQPFAVAGEVFQIKDDDAIKVVASPNYSHPEQIIKYDEIEAHCDTYDILADTLDEALDALTTKLMTELFMSDN